MEEVRNVRRGKRRKWGGRDAVHRSELEWRNWSPGKVTRGVEEVRTGSSSPSTYPTELRTATIWYDCLLIRHALLRHLQYFVSSIANTPNL
nr:hypothetical protein Iba_chr07dCG5180 [Ipomoea batatas]